MTVYRSLITVTDYGGAQSVRGKPRWKRASCAWVSPYVSIIYLLFESALARRILEKLSQIVIIIIDDASFATRFSFFLSFFLLSLYFFFYSFPISDFFVSVDFASDALSSNTPDSARNLTEPGTCVALRSVRDTGWCVCPAFPER